jgi:hypothetical protein
VTGEKKASDDTPVALIFYNRPHTTQLVIDRLRALEPRQMFLIQDGPRLGHPNDAEGVEQARAVAESIDWDCQITRIYAAENMGLKARVSSGLDEVFRTVDRAIILEDDCVPDASFFPYATELLERYANDERVGTISGNNFLRGKSVTDNSYYFTRDVRIWGWATWRRVWTDFSDNGLNHQWSPVDAKQALEGFPSKARKKTLLAMAANSHQLNSWALPLVLHCQRRGYLSAAPVVNLVANVGFGRGSTHTIFEDFTVDIAEERLSFPLRHPDHIVSNSLAGDLEALLFRREWLTFPVRHPIDFTGRIFRYLKHRFNTR